ncbi:hypothetical protein KY289_007677 [Solanum tuberosum]|nr:hypothetical protein KY289_007677 [Solanum tuberosum]
MKALKLPSPPKSPSRSSKANILKPPSRKVLGFKQAFGVVLKSFWNIGMLNSVITEGA